MISAAAQLGVNKPACAWFYPLSVVGGSLFFLDASSFILCA
jgi:hypothetical protein